LKHTTVLQILFRMFWIERTEVFKYLVAYYNTIIQYRMSILEHINVTDLLKALSNRARKKTRC
jgi:hypothetical protein